MGPLRVRVRDVLWRQMVWVLLVLAGAFLVVLLWSSWADKASAQPTLSLGDSTVQSLLSTIGTSNAGTTTHHHRHGLDDDDVASDRPDITRERGV